MKHDIHSCPELVSALCNDEIVYLFGTGISSALTGEAYSWRKWIADGIQSVKNRRHAQKWEDSLNADSSADNMIRVVGEVLAETKRDGTYQGWMKRSFESNPVRNMQLARTLKKLLLTQDVFATTNYDLLLEQATGLSCLTYEQPDEAFSMLEHRVSRSVLHIHGAYDSVRGIDNIVADAKQYKAVLDDKGAQFIQNILGTRTLIFVGCGQTAEDANISQFIQFAQKYLKLDKTYFFLCKNGQTGDGLPKNVISIPYGDEYGDLPLFLEDMAQVRLRAKIESNPMVDRTIYMTDKGDAYGLSEYHFSKEYLKFCGRKTEIGQLKSFAQTDKLFSWWAITGQGGAGKSRLAFEMLHRLGHEYFAFFLNAGTTREQIDAFQPFHDTFVVVDYIKGNEKQIAAVVERLYDRFAGTWYKLRILFLERDNQLLTGSWYRIMTAAMPTAFRTVFEGAEHNVPLLSGTHRFVYLEDMEEEAVTELIGEVCAKKGLPEDRHRDNGLKEEYSRKFEQLRFRPLYLQLYIEAWIENGCLQVDYRNDWELLVKVMQKEQDRLLALVDHDIAVCNCLLRLLVRAGIQGELRTDALPPMYEEDWKRVKACAKAHSLPGIQRAEYLATLVRDAQQGLADDIAVIRPLYPDIIKEAMFIYYTDEEELESVGAELWENCPLEFMTFLSRLLIDFADNALMRAYIRSVSDDCKNEYALEARLALLQNEVVRSVEEGPILCELAHAEAAFWRDVPVGDESTQRLKAIKLRGLNLGARKLIGWSSRESLDVLDAIAEFDAGSSLIGQKINYLLDHAHYFTEKCVWKTSERIVGRLEPILEQLPDENARFLLWLRLQREHMVNLIVCGEEEKAWAQYEEIADAVDFSEEQQVEQYAYLVDSCVAEAFSSLKFPLVLNYSYELQDMAEAYGRQEEPIAFNDKIHYYYLHSKAIQLECVSVAATLGGMGEYGIDIVDGLMDEIEGNIMISDFSGLLVWMWGLKVGYDESVSDADAVRFLDRTDAFLEEYPENELLAAKAMDLWECVYSLQFKKTVPQELVERGYALVLRFSNSVSVIDSFYNMLKSTEIRNDPVRWADFFRVKAILPKLIEHRRMDYMQPPEPEHRTVQREKPKVGPNERCPCGSGKKFKKCCRGNGRFD